MGLKMDQSKEVSKTPLDTETSQSPSQSGAHPGGQQQPQRSQQLGGQLKDYFKIPEKPIPTSGLCDQLKGKGLPTEKVVDGVNIKFGEDPICMKCPECNEQITTTTKSTPGILAGAFGCLLFSIGFGIYATWLCCCIPCLVVKLQDVEHSCPKVGCNKVLGRYKSAK